MSAIEAAPAPWSRDEQDYERRRLLRLLRAGKLRYGEVAVQIGVSEGGVRHWAAGVRPVSRPYQVRLREILDAAPK